VEMLRLTDKKKCKIEDLLIETARKHDVSLSSLYFMSKGLSDSSIARLCGNVEILPKYIKSKVSP
jgi:hypothetical protein